MIPLKHITLMPNPYRDQGFRITQATAEILRQGGAEVKVCLPFHVERLGEVPQGMRFVTMEEALRDCELLICFGGDGTILHMAKAATKRNIPILGVNIGTMGFMAELESTEMDKLAKIATGDYKLDTRMMLDVTIQRDRDIIFHDICLNDVAITKGSIGRIVTLNVKCDNVTAMECGGDGVIISTPTGSTAYSLSAGGPIVEPDARNIIITPVCAHDMISRSMVMSDKRNVTVQMVHNARRNAFVSVDGGKAIRMNMGDTAFIKKSSLETKLIRLNGRSFYDVLNTKFGKV